MLRERLRALIAEYRILWVARDREGGLSDSVGRLERILPPLYTRAGRCAQ
jgi:hypothetical protein